MRTPVALALTAVLGLGAVVGGWYGSAQTLLPGQQMAWLVSGGLVGLALIGTALTVLALYLERAEMALRSVQAEEALRQAARLASPRA